MSQPISLLVHIGHGKTGSTSIQQTLLKNRDALLERGVAYLGRMLEHCETSEPKEWQHADGAVRLLHQMPADTAGQEIYSVLTEELDRLKTIGVHTAIWSNEAFFARREAVCDALEKLREDGVAVTIIVYLRRHDKWAKSAYAQWGIRHKSYEGPVKSFQEWIKLRPVHFADNLEFWDQHFGSDLLVRNFDETPDVVADFFEKSGITDIDAIRAYETPSPQALMAWAVHNSRTEKEVQPDAFGRLLRPSRLFWEPAKLLDAKETYCPTEDELDQILSECAPDLERINKIFAAHGEPVFDTKDKAKASPVPDDWEMIQYMMVMVFSLQEQVLRLKRRIDELEN
jgi:hypothetical protein